MPKVKSNIYRVLKPCSNCPFLDNGKEIHLNSGRVDDIKETLLSSDRESFNCHKTVYDLDTQMNSTDKQELKMCAGAYQFLKDQKRPNLQMKFALSMGIEKEL